jgi:hypothetical protein
MFSKKKKSYKLLKILAFMLLFCSVSKVNSPLYASSEGPVGVEIYYDQSFLGEKNPGLYYGPTDPLYWQNPYQGELVWWDQMIEESYFDQKLIPYARDFKLFINSELVEGESCPTEVLGKNFHYLRYLYRLISMSYLYESLLYYQAYMDKEYDKHACQIDWQEFLSSCSPQSSLSKKFVQYSKNFLFRNHQDYLKNLTSTLHDNLSKVISDRNHIIGRRVNHFCQHEGHSSCSAKKRQSKKLMTHVCDYDKKLFQTICNEQDQLFGSSHIGLAYYLLSESHVVNMFQDEDQAVGCLRRFSQVTKVKERRYRSLEDIYPLLNHQLRERFDGRYQQGRLFIPGSLKEFEEKGLDQIFSIKEVDQPEIVEEPTPEPVVVSEVTKPVVSKKPVPIVKKVAPKPKKKKKPRKSAFLLASEILEKFRWDRVKVNMMKFKYDYVFKHDQLERLSETMPQYMKRKVLEEMKKYDKLGQEQGPIPLVFIKYMIETDQHQGLFNIVHTLGNQFYVKNNVDMPQFVKGVELVELKNDVSTNRQWQIYILSDQQDIKTTVRE